MLVSAANDLKFHKIGDEEWIVKYNEGVSSYVTSLSWSKDGNYLVFLQDGGHPEILCVKNVNKIKPIHVITAVENVTTVSFPHKTRRFLALGTNLSQVVLYDTRSKSIEEICNVDSPVEFVEFNTTDEIMAVACTNCCVFLVNVQLTDEPKVTERYNLPDIPTAIRFHSAYEDVFGVATKCGTLFVFNAKQQGAIYESIAVHCGVPRAIVFGGDCTTLVSVGDDCNFCVHNISKQECVFRAHLGHPLTTADICPDDKYLAIGNNKGTITIYEMSNFLAPIMTCDAHTQAITVLRFAHISDPVILNQDPKKEVVETILPINDTKQIDGTISNNGMIKLYEKIAKAENDDDYLRLLKDDLLEDIQKDNNQLQILMTNHLSNFNEFMKKEFDKMSEQMDDKWELVHSVSGNYKSSDPALYKSSDPALEQDFDLYSPVIIE